MGSVETPLRDGQSSTRRSTLGSDERAAAQGNTPGGGFIPGRQERYFSASTSSTYTKAPTLTLSVASLAGAMPGESVAGDLTQPLGSSPGEAPACPQTASTATQSTAPAIAPGSLIVHLPFDRTHDVTDPSKIACCAQRPHRAYEQ